MGTPSRRLPQRGEGHRAGQGGVTSARGDTELAEPGVTSANGGTQLAEAGVASVSEAESAGAEGAGAAPPRRRGGEWLPPGLRAERGRRLGGVRGGVGLPQGRAAEPRSFPAGGRRPGLGPEPEEGGVAPPAPGGEGPGGRRLGGKKPEGGADCSQLGCHSLGFPQPQRTPGFRSKKLGLACVGQVSQLKV